MGLSFPVHPGAAMAMWNMFVVLPVIYLVNQIDFTNEMNVLLLRAAFVLVHCAVGAVVYLLSLKIKAKDDRTPVKTEAGETTTVRDYDLGELRQYLTGLGFSLLISGFLHYKMELIPPLAVQGVLNPVNLFQVGPFVTSFSTLVLIHFSSTTSSKFTS